MDIIFRLVTPDSPICAIVPSILGQQPAAALGVIGANSRDEAIQILLNRIRRVLPACANINDVIDWIQQYYDMLNWRIANINCTNQAICAMMLIYIRDRRLMPIQSVYQQHRWDDNTDEAAAIIAICVWDYLRPQVEPIINIPGFVLEPMQPHARTG